MADGKRRRKARTQQFSNTLPTPFLPGDNLITSPPITVLICGPSEGGVLGGGCVGADFTLGLLCERKISNRVMKSNILEVIKESISLPNAADDFWLEGCPVGIDRCEEAGNPSHAE